MVQLAWLAAAGSFLSSSSVESPSLVKRAALDTCLENLKVPVYASNTTRYTQAVKPFNIRLPFTPAAYAVPKTVEDVQNAVKCGVQSKIRVTAKSGGHSYAAHGLGGEDGHLVVDMRQFNSVTVDAAAHTAVIGSGGRLGNIALSLYSQGKQAMSHGTCPGVGIGGLSLHGGYGLISRLKGLTLDNLISANVVLADGRAVTASATENADLFWSLRGAGAAFGIVTAFKYKTFDAPENNLVFSYSLSPSNASQMASMLGVLQEFTMNTQPPELNMRLFLPNQFTGVYYGSRADYNATMNPLLVKLGIPLSGRGAGTVSTKGWIDTLLANSNGPLAQPEIYTYQEKFYAKSLMPDYLSPAALTALADYYYTVARRQSHGNYYLLIDMPGGAKSAISAVANDATAYAHRNATFKMQFNDRVFPDTAAYKPEYFDFLNGWVKAIENASNGAQFGMYINYADTNLTDSVAHTRYWKENYARLLSVKGKYDPGKVFEGPQLVGS
jgi:hypothetical protein